MTLSGIASAPVRDSGGDPCGRPSSFATGDPCGRPSSFATGDHKGRPYDGSRVLVGLRRSLAGDVSVRNDAGEEVAAAIITYKLTGYRPRPDMG